MKTYSFEKLEVWQDARKMIKEIYQLTSAFPEKEKFGLTSQIRRAMISVSCNIAEGTSRRTGKEKVRFIEISFGSLMEVLNCLILAFDLEYITDKDLKEKRLGIDKIGYKLNALANYFRNE